MEKLLLSIREVSEITGISVGTLYHWASEKRIAVVRLSRRCLKFRRSDIEKMISEKVEEASGVHKDDCQNR